MAETLGVKLKQIIPFKLNTYNGEYSYSIY